MVFVVWSFSTDGVSLFQGIMPIKIVKHRININNDYYGPVFVFKRNRSMYLTKKKLKRASPDKMAGQGTDSNSSRYR